MGEYPVIRVRFGGFIMLLTVEGYFEAGRFIADTPIQIPERRKTIITVLDEKVDKENGQERYIAYWNKIIEDIQNSDEVLEGEPERIRFKTPEEIDAL
jgi:hypothetical protein